MGVVVAQHPAVTRHGVLVECTGLLVLTQCPQVDGDIVSGGQGVGMVVAQHPTVARHGVLA
jgi:hypothetical protein